MKKIYFVLVSLICIQAQAQVTIPDANLRNKLKSLFYYAPCFNGDVLDTVAAANVANYNLEIKNSNISNLDGIQYFKQLNYLRCDSNQITSISKLPPLLDDFSCRVNQLTNLINLPLGLTKLDCKGNALTKLPSPLPARLTNLQVDNNHLTALPTLPPSLHLLICNNNQLMQLPELFNTKLFFIICTNNQLSDLPALPVTLGTLMCSNNLIHVLPALPTSLTHLEAGSNAIQYLPALPSNMAGIYIDGNPITCLPTLPGTLDALQIDRSKITCLPNIPSGISNQFVNYPVCNQACNVTGLAALKANRLPAFYPNPVNDVVFFQEAAMVEIFSFQGELILKSNGMIQSIETTHLPMGLYHLIYTDLSGFHRHEKMIKQ
jgi:Leucine-rich repeat (LRR) protein